MAQSHQHQPVAEIESGGTLSPYNTFRIVRDPSVYRLTATIKYCLKNRQLDSHDGAELLASAIESWAHHVPDDSQAGYTGLEIRYRGTIGGEHVDLVTRPADHLSTHPDPQVVIRNEQIVPIMELVALVPAGEHYTATTMANESATKTKNQYSDQSDN